MTDLRTDPALDLAAFEADLAGHLRLDPGAQDLLFREAHTASRYRDEPVTDEQVRAVHDLVKWAPTAFNAQPLRMVLVRSAEARERLVRHMAGGNRDRVRHAPLVVVLAADHEFHEELPRVLPGFPGARDLYAGQDSRFEAARFNTALQAGYFLVGVRAAGLAAGPMTGFDAAGVTRELFGDGEHEALLVVTIGWPADDAYRPRQPRLDFDEVATTI